MRNVVLDLNYIESAALMDAHVKKYKFRTEDDIVATQSSTDWCNRSATSLVKDCWMYSTTEGIAVKAQQISTQQIIACDTTDDDCNGVDLITVFNYVMDAGCVDCIDSDADSPESSNGGSGGSDYYYGYYYGSEQKHLVESKCHFISELEDLMKCSYQSGYNFDQVSLPIESGHETGRSAPEQERCAFPARPNPDQSFKRFER